MSDQPRAVFFDLDDTLYLERRFALSGFHRIATLVAATVDVDAADAFRVLVACLKRGDRAIAFQVLCETYGFPPDSVPGLVDVYRRHLPVLTLPPSSRRVLEQLRGDWKLAVVTNGLPDVQRRKVAALGLDRLVDLVICAHEHGRGEGKPDRAPFLAAAARLHVEPARVVFVGDDPHRDIAGARAVGMHTIRLRRGTYRWTTYPAASEADAVTARIQDVPPLAAALLAEKQSKCA